MRPSSRMYLSSSRTSCRAPSRRPFAASCRRRPGIGRAPRRRTSVVSLAIGELNLPLVVPGSQDPNSRCRLPALGIWSRLMTISATRPVGLPAAVLPDEDHEQIVIRQDPRTGMRLIVAVHSTVLGPSLGGLRMKRYPGGLREALDDVMCLARTMTLKASAAGLDLGGGKAVMIDDGAADARLERLEAAAGVIEGLGGAYITAEDIG